MRVRVVVGLLAVAAALVAGAIVWRGTRQGVAEPDIAAETDAQAVGSAAPALAASPRAIVRSSARGTGVIFGTVHDGRAGGKPLSAKMFAWRTTPYEGGRAVPGAQGVWDAEPRDVMMLPPNAEGQADQAGQFELTALPAGVYVVAARASEDPVVYGEVWATISFDGDRTRSDITVMPGALSLTIKARRSDGSPWRVRVGASGNARCPVGDTDESGTVVLSGLGAGDTQLDVFAASEGIRITTTVTLPTNEPFVVTEPSGLVEVSGRVIEAGSGTPLVGARVSSSASLAHVTVSTHGESGPDGAFRLRVVPSISGVKASADGYVDGKGVLRGKATGITIALRRRSRLTGSVVDAATRAPVPGVRVLVAGAGETDSFRAYRMYTRPNPLNADLGTTSTDAGGRFAIDLDAVGEAELRVIGNGWCSKGLGAREGSGTTTVEVTAGGEANVMLEVERAARVSGRVLDAEGRPAPGAIVHAMPHSTEAAVRNRWGAPQAGLPAEAGVDGRFVLDAVLPGIEVDLMAQRSDVSGPAVALGALESGSTREVELRLARTRNVVITVVRDADGKPVADANVTLQGEQNGWKSETTDGAGVVRLTFVSAAASQVVATTNGRSGRTTTPPARTETGQADIPAVDGATGPLEDVEITIRVRVPNPDDEAATKLTISGIVQYPDGTPAAGSWVSRSDGENLSVGRSRRRFNGWNGTQVEVGPDGAFHIEVDDVPLVHLNALASRLGAEWAATIDASPGSKAVTITVRELGTDDASSIHVRVLDPDGSAVASASAQVKLQSGNTTHWNSVDVEDGDLEISRSAEGVEIDITSARGPDGSRLAVAAFHFGPAPTAQLPIKIQLRAEKLIEGFVRTPDGTPIAGATVSAERVEAGAAAPAPGISLRRLAGRGRFFGMGGESTSGVRSGADGAFRLRGLDDAEYQLTVEASSEFVNDDEMNVRAKGGATGVVLTLRPGVVVTIHVVDPDGRPVAGATADAARAGESDDGSRRVFGHFRRQMARMGQGGTGVADAEGAIRIVSLDAALTYMLTVDPPDERRDVQPRKVDAWKPAGDTIRLERSRSTRGFVRSPKGEGLGGVAVEWKLGAASNSLSTEEDGSFVIEHSEAGEIEFAASLSSEGESAKARAHAGAQDVVIVLNPGAELSVRLDPAEPEPDEIHIAREGAEAGDDDAAPHQVREGVCRFRGLRADQTYTVWTVSRQRPLVGILTGLHPSGVPVTLRRVPGKSIHVRISGPDGLDLDDVTVVARRGAVHVEGFTTEPGPKRGLVVEGLVDGRWRVEAETMIGDDSYEGKADADAGGDVEIRLMLVSK